MRIVSGFLGGREIKTVPGDGMRPAMGKTREALFSSLEAGGLVWEGARVLDLFAGCGSLGFECLSRGAESALFVDNSEAQCKCLGLNVARLSLSGKAVIQRQDVGRFLRRRPQQQFSLVFLDPPYGKRLVQQALVALIKNSWVKSGGIVIAELERKAPLPEIASLGEPDCRFFGQTTLYIWKMK